MKQVQEMSRMARVIESIRIAFVALTVNETVTSNEFQAELDNIRSQENTEKITELEERTTSVNIPLEENESFVKKANVSEKEASKNAEKVKQAKTKKVAEAQKTIGEE